LIHVDITYPLPLTICLAAPGAACAMRRLPCARHLEQLATRKESRVGKTPAPTDARYRQR
jgi:hypothetical protein